MKFSNGHGVRWHTIGLVVGMLVIGCVVEEVRAQPSSAACCLPNGTCTLVDAPFQCDNLGGEYIGNSFTCTSVVCTGACCLPNKSCASMGSSNCASAGGAYQGRGSICGDDCPSVMPTAFTYQGQLKRTGIPVNEPVNGKFSLWLSPTGTDPADQIGSTLTINSIDVANGLFSVPLDFGQNAFNGNARWLQIEIHGQNDAPGVFTTLSPRQSITPSPYSIETRGIVVTASGNVGIGTKTPTSKVEIAAQDGLALTGYQPFVTLRDTNGGNLRSIIQGADGKFIFYPNSFIGSAPAMVINNGTGNVGIGTASPDVKLHVVGGSDSEPGGGGYIVAGSTTGANLSIDNNEIMARNNGATSTLSLNNDGGDVNIGGRVNVHTSVASSVYLGDSSADLSGFFVCPPFAHVCGELAYFAGDQKTHLIADVKNFRMENPIDPSTEIWYASVEGPEAAAYTRGTSRLVSGTATIQLPDHFKVVAAEETMTVQITPLSAQSRGLSVTRKSLDGIEVHELNNGSGEYDFDWEVKAVRKGYEDYQVIQPKH